MKVLLIHQAFTAPDEPGGTRHFELATHCEKVGIDFTIVASDLAYLTGKRVVSNSGFVSEQRIKPVTILRARTLATLHRSFVWRVVSFLSFMVTSVIAGMKAGKVDLVMGTSPPIFQGLSAWTVAFLRRKPFLMEVRDLWPEFAIDIGLLKNPILIWMARMLENFLYWQADHIVVNSPAYRNYMIKKKGLSPDKVTLIENGVCPDMFNPASIGQAFRQEFGLEKKLVVTYAGAVGLANDLETFVKAAALTANDPGLHFMVIGDGKERMNVEDLARDLGVVNITFAGAIPKSKMPEILAGSDLCVAILRNIPMFRTTYPNKVFDYMAAGRAIVLAIDGVIRDVVEQSQCGVFVEPGDPKALYEAIDKLRQDRELREQMGRNGRETVVSKFNRADQAGSFGQLLKELVE